MCRLRQQQFAAVVDGAGIRVGVVRQVDDGQQAMAVFAAQHGCEFGAAAARHRHVEHQRVGSEVVEQLRHRERVDGLAHLHPGVAQDRSVARQLQGVVVDDQHPRRLRRGEGAAAVERLQQHLAGDRLGQVVRGAGAVGGEPGFHVVARRQEDDRHAGERLRLHLGDERRAGGPAIRKARVHEQRRRAVAVAAGLAAVGEAVEHLDPVARRLQHLAQPDGLVGVVVDHQDAQRGPQRGGRDEAVGRVLRFRGEPRQRLVQREQLGLVGHALRRQAGGERLELARGGGDFHQAVHARRTDQAVRRVAQQLCGAGFAPRQLLEHALEDVEAPRQLRDEGVAQAGQGGFDIGRHGGSA